MFFKKWLWKYFIFMMSFVFFVSCKSTTHQEEILRKSEKITPYWVVEFENGNTSAAQSVDSERKEIVFRRSHVYNLSLGIKQFESMIFLRLKSMKQVYFLKSVYWEYRQEELPTGPESYYVIWIRLSAPKSNHEKVLRESEL